MQSQINDSIGLVAGGSRMQMSDAYRFLIALCNNRKEQARGSCLSNLAAPLTLRCVAAL